MSKPVQVFTESAGVNNVSPLFKLLVNWNNGMSELRDSLNCIFDTATGAVSRRRGWSLIVEELDSRNAIAANGCVYFVVKNILYRIDSSHNTVVLTDSLAVDEFENTLDTVFGLVSGRIYLTNGVDYLFVKPGEELLDWILPPEYYGPVTQREFQGPPENITKIFGFDGRVMCVVDKWIIYSERYDHGRFSLADNSWPFPSTIIDAEKVGEKCVYAGTPTGVYSVVGDDAVSVKRERVTNDVMLKGSLKVTMLSNAEGVVMPVAIWVGNEGVYIGDETGKVVCLSADKFKFDVTTVQWCAVIDGVYWCKFDESVIANKGIYLNTKRRAFGFFSGLPFTWVGQLQKEGLVFGLSEFGICSVFGSEDGTDNGEEIYASFELPRTDLTTESPKRLRNFTLGYTATDKLLLSVIQGNGQRVTYEVPNSGHSTKTISFSRITNRTTPSRYIGFLIENTDGGEFTIDSLNVLPVATASRSSY